MILSMHHSPLTSAGLGSRALRSMPLRKPTGLGKAVSGGDAVSPSSLSAPKILAEIRDPKPCEAARRR